jgi:hypothetical protein
MTPEQMEALARELGQKTYERMMYLMGGGREIVHVSKWHNIELFYETWFEWDNMLMPNKQRPIKGYVVVGPYNSQQHRFQNLSEADRFFDQLVEKYARQIGLYALGIE